MSETPESPPVEEPRGSAIADERLSAPPERPRWLAAAAVLLIGLAIGSVLALRYDRGSDDATSPSVVDTSAAEASAPETSASESSADPATTAETSAVTTDSSTVSTERSVPTTDTVDTVDDSTSPTIADGIGPGDGIASMIIPKIDITAFVVAGSSTTELAVGVGHVSTTPVPGQLGNSVLVGFRTTKPAPFEELDLLAVGDVIEINTVAGDRFFYGVDSSVVVEATDAAVVANSTPAVATLSMITCAPKGSTLQRLVVHATLIESLSSPAGEAEINYGQDGMVPAPSVDPCNVVPAASGG